MLVMIKFNNEVSNIFNLTFLDFFGNGYSMEVSPDCHVPNSNFFVFCII